MADSPATVLASPSGAAPAPRPLRVGDQVRAQVGDAVLVHAGLTGLVVNVQHYGYGGHYGQAAKRPWVRVRWANDTTSMTDIADLERISDDPAPVLPRNTLTALTPGDAR